MILFDIEGIVHHLHASLYFGSYGWGASVSSDLHTYLQTSASAQTAPEQQTPRALLWTP